MTDIDFTASILASPDDDRLTEVDIRTLSADRLTALRGEAGAAGDTELVAIIDTWTTSNLKEALISVGMAAEQVRDSITSVAILAGQAYRHVHHGRPDAAEWERFATREAVAGICAEMDNLREALDDLLATTGAR